MKLEREAIIAISLFLAASGACHLIAPVQAERLLSQRRPVQAIGALLSILGGAALAGRNAIGLWVGIPVLLSGLARLFAPARMIELNKWCSRYGHGVLMLLGAAACVIAGFGLF